MSDNNIPLIYKIIIAISGGIFGIGIAVAIGHIRLFYVPKILLISSCVLQFMLSLGVFLGVILFFKSSLLPDIIPNDEYTMLFCAYAFSTIPQFVTTTLVFMYDKAITNWIEKKFGESKNGETSTDNQFSHTDMVSIYKNNKKDNLSHKG